MWVGKNDLESNFYAIKTKNPGSGLIFFIIKLINYS